MTRLEQLTQEIAAELVDRFSDACVQCLRAELRAAQKREKALLEAGSKVLAWSRGEADLTALREGLDTLGGREVADLVMDERLRLRQVEAQWERERERARQGEEAER
jgi:hypothetical protein